MSENLIHPVEPKKPGPMTTTDLEALSPKSIAELAMAATLRSKTASPPWRPVIHFWTDRRVKGKHALLLGVRVRGKVVAPPAHIAARRPENATAFVRVWAADLWDWVMQHHGEIGRAVEIAAASVWEPLGPPPQEGTKAINAWRSAMRDQVNGLAQLLEARALGKEASEEPPIEGPTDG